MDQSYNRPPWFTALASRKERDDFSSLKHVLGEPHTASSQSHIFLLPSRVIRHARLMLERQAAKPLGRQKFEIISLILMSLLVIALAGIITGLQALSLSGSTEIQFLLVQTSKAKNICLQIAYIRSFWIQEWQYSTVFPAKIGLCLFLICRI